MDSAIGEDLLALNCCRTNYQDDCFSVLHRARDNVQFNILEAIYMAIDPPSLCRQKNSHILNILGDALDTGVTKMFWFFAQSFSTLYQLPVFTTFRRFCMNRAGRKGPRSLIKKKLFSPSLPMIPLILCSYKFSCAVSLLYIYIYIYRERERERE